MANDRSTLGIDAEFIGQAVIDGIIEMALIGHDGPPDGGKEGHVMVWSGNAAEQIGTLIVRRFAPQHGRCDDDGALQDNG